MKLLAIYGWRSYIDNRYTWSNIQSSPLLERLDWFLAYVSLITNYPGSMAKTLSRDTSDHFSCLVFISANIPKAKVFQFENYWLLHDEFMQRGWNTPSPFVYPAADPAKRLVAKFKTYEEFSDFGILNWLICPKPLKAIIHASFFGCPGGV
jgi:hypothetical protein